MTNDKEAPTNRVLVHQGNDAILLGFDEEPGRFDHLLDRRDRKNVHTVIGYLLDNNIKPYLTGGVVNDHIYQNKRHAYNDIDLVGITQNANLFTTPESVMKLIREARLQTLMQSKVAREYITREQENPLPGFGIKDLGNGKRGSYVGGLIEERFTLTPKSIILTPADIDLSIVADEIKIPLTGEQITEKMIEEIESPRSSFYPYTTLRDQKPTQ